MTGKSIILDLDDTIFQTRTIERKIFEPFLDHFTANLKPDYDDKTIESIIDDLWGKTWDIVLNKYGIARETLMTSIAVLEQLDVNLNITTYPDYVFIKSIPCPKFLVTTSLTSIQELKIKALKIENDFTKIVINDPFKESKSKQDIFKDLVREFSLIPERTYVIGDNADSEIKAGNSLNMITIQILRENVKKGENARFYIRSFSELESIIKQ